MRLVELNHVIEPGMVTYKGLPGPLICDFLSREASQGNYVAGTEFQIGRIDMVGNTGTYLDTPFHRYADGADLAGVALVGIDSHNIDDTAGNARPVHTVLLGAGIPIVEHLTRLGDLPDAGFIFNAPPPRIRGMGTFPVRAHALVE